MSFNDFISGFVADNHHYLGLMNVFPQWTVTQYDYDYTKLVKTNWMSRHKEIELVANKRITLIEYKYREMGQVLFLAAPKSIINIEIYDYHGGELRIVPDKEAKVFSVFYQGKLVSKFKSANAEYGYDKNGYRLFLREE
ncbi:MAG: hypothetical protein CfClM3_0256 [Methanobrevibacter sp. CfCl-M3]